MKLKLAGMSLMLFWVCSVIAQSSPVRTGQDLRIMSYNIHNGMGLDGRRDLERIAAVILEVNPDIVALQEVDSVTERSGKQDMMQILGEYTLMRPIFGEAIPYQGREIRSRYFVPGKAFKLVYFAASGPGRKKSFIDC